MNAMTWLQNGASWAWHTSLVAAIPALILLVLGCWRGFSARWRMFFAAALLLRLLLPSVPELPGHPGASLERAIAPGSALPQVQVQPQVSDEEIFSLEDDASVSDAAPSVAEVDHPIPWQSVIAAIWALGAIAIGAWLLSSHWLIRRWVSRRATAPDPMVARLFQRSCKRMGLLRRVGLVEIPGIATAAVCGWLRPLVLVPANLRETHTNDEIHGILLHELAHVRRRDVLWSWLGLAACALHWFNPFAWLALRRFHADREMECDRMALDHLAAPQRSSYAPALFKTLQGPTLATSAALVPFFRHKHEIHNRILTIMKPSKSLIARLAALTIIPALSVLTLTTAGADDEKKPTEETPTKQRDGEGIKKGPRDGEVKKEGPRDGEIKKEGPRDGEVKKEGAPDGERKVKVARDGEGEIVKKDKGPRDGEVKKDAPRDGEIKKEGLRDGERKKVIRDGDGEVPVKKAFRDGEERKSGDSVANQVEAINAKIAALEAQRNALLKKGGEGAKVAGEGGVKKVGPRNGEIRKTGPRDGEVKKVGPRDGEAPKEGDKPKFGQ